MSQVYVEGNVASHHTPLYSFPSLHCINVHLNACNCIFSTFILTYMKLAQSQSLAIFKILEQLNRLNYISVSVTHFVDGNTESCLWYLEHFSYVHTCMFYLYATVLLLDHLVTVVAAHYLQSP